MLQLFNKRYTKDGVRAFYSKEENEVHLTYPDSMSSPFTSRLLDADVVDNIRREHGVWVTWTPYGSKSGVSDDSSLFSSWVEVIL